jgi:hypothetical protein
MVFEVIISWLSWRGQELKVHWVKSFENLSGMTWSFVLNLDKTICFMPTAN